MKYLITVDYWVLQEADSEMEYSCNVFVKEGLWD